jgi:hypothetical protein
MTHEIIHTADYLLVVDDSEIKDGDWMHRNDEQPTFVTPNFWWDFKDRYRKIIAHLPLNNSPILEGVDLLPPLEIDEDFNPIGEYTKEYLSSLMFDGKSFVSHVLLATKVGYNKAREKYKFTEKDMRKAIEMAREKHDYLHGYSWNKEQIIQSLSQPKMPIGFECDMGHKFPSGREYVQPNPDYLPKTTTNNLGQTQWVGKYIYA